MEKRITGTTTLLGLIGTPVAHSGSPSIYNYGFALQGIDYAYLAFDIDKDKVPDAITAMKTLRMRGCNVTYPCKTAVMPHMDELSPAASLIGAVNTIVNEDGKLHGYNTDGEGFVRNLNDYGYSVEGKRILLCGAGGAATSILVQCALDHAAEIYVFNRKSESFARISEKAQEIMHRVPQVKIEVCDLENQELLQQTLAKCEILINGTSVGMAPNEDASVIPDDCKLPKELLVCDVIYHPLETKLMRKARECGCRVVGGKGMLLWQAASAYELYTGRKLPVKEVKKEYFTDL